MLRRVTLCSLVFALVFWTGCRTASPVLDNPAFETSFKWIDLANLAKDVGDLDARVGNVEGELVIIKQQTATILSTSTQTAGVVKSLLTETSSGPFAGSGVWAFGALVAILAAQLAGIVLYLKLRRDVKNNAALKPSGASS